jgi:hypothetical protein
MPKTKVILSVAGEIPLDEVRRRVVALQHLDRPTPFSAATDWQTRAEAVLTWLQQKNKLTLPPGDVSAAKVRRWLDQPLYAARWDNVLPDDIAMIAVASLLTVPGTAQNQQISDALRTRGVTGMVRRNARSEVVAHVVCRMVPTGCNLDARRSAMERALRWTALRGQELDSSPPETLLAKAFAELDAADVERALGRAPQFGPATLQLATRAALYLICAPQGGEAPLPRGNACEPDAILEKLAGTRAGLEQLAQAIFDGRRCWPVRRVPVGDLAQNNPARPAAEDVLTTADLLKLALQQEDVVADASAAKKIAADSRELRALLDRAVEMTRQMATHSDATVPYVEEHGWSDPHDCMPLIDELAKLAGYWRQRHFAVNRPRPTDESLAVQGSSW